MAKKKHAPTCGDFVVNPLPPETLEFSLSGPMRRGAADSALDRFTRAHLPVARPEAEKTILSQRAGFYAPSAQAEKAVAAATGRMIRGLLESHFQQPLPGDIPPHVVHLLFVALKTARAALPHKRRDDNYIDAHNYLTLAERNDERTTADENPYDRVEHRIRSNGKTASTKSRARGAGRRKG